MKKLTVDDFDREVQKGEQRRCAMEPATDAEKIEVLGDLEVPPAEHVPVGPDSTFLNDPT